MDEDIRDQITREDILDAIAALDRGEAHAFGPSTFYDLLEDERRYPAAQRTGRTVPASGERTGREHCALRRCSCGDSHATCVMSTGQNGSP